MARKPKDTGPWPKEGLRRADGAPACGAKSRKGTPCMMIPAAGNRRCRMHRGGSPGRDAQVLLARPAGVEVSTAAARTAARSVGDVRAGDPEVLDMRETIAGMLSLAHAARPLVVDESTADGLIDGLIEAGLDVDDDLERQLRDGLREVQFDRTMKLIDRLSRVASAQTNAIKVQQVGQLLMQQLLPLISDFAHRLALAAERFIPAEHHEEWRIEARRVQAETRSRVVEEAVEVQNVAGR